jgi:hypothetical protein
MNFSSVLIDFAISCLGQENNYSMSREAETQLKLLLCRLTRGQIPFDQCKRDAALLVPSVKGIDRLSIILTMPESPLPPAVPRQCEVSRNRRHPWTELEDNRLLCGLHRYGLRDWGEIAKFVGNSRSRSQCEQRWSRGLDPRISRNLWSSDEDTKLIALVMNFGTDGWRAISLHMGNRSDVQCRYRYIQLKKYGECSAYARSCCISLFPPSVSLMKLLRKKKGRPMKHPEIMLPPPVHWSFSQFLNSTRPTQQQKKSTQTYRAAIMPEATKVQQPATSEEELLDW